MPAPNIVVILTDQQRLDTIAARHTSFPAKTPAMDDLYRHGVFFENAYCTAPICGPSRSTLLTGLYPSQTGVYANLGNPCAPLNEGIRTIGRRMQALGYHTAYHGKWHLGGAVQHYGFETAFENSHDASTLTEASRFLRNRDWVIHQRPFFQIVSFLNPHDVYFFDPEASANGISPRWANQDDDLKNKPWPQHAQRRDDWPAAWWESYRRYYARKLEEVDACVAEYLRHLIDSGWGPNTWIIFTSDHGDMAGEHGIAFKGPYMYEGVVRAPLIVVPPQKRFVGKGKGTVGGPAFVRRTCGELVSLTDIVPTILELGGDERDSALPGRSLMPLVRGEAVTANPGEGERAVFAEWHQFGKLVTPIRMIRTGRWKYNLYVRNGAELYDLAADPGECVNLAGRAEIADVERNLRARLLEHIERTGDPFFNCVPTDAAGEPFASESETTRQAGKKS